MERAASRDMGAFWKLACMNAALSLSYRPPTVEPLSRRLGMPSSESSRGISAITRNLLNGVPAIGINSHSKTVAVNWNSSGNLTGTPFSSVMTIPPSMRAIIS